jgi:DNA-binding transcriptional ArsR family regulator
MITGARTLTPARTEGTGQGDQDRDIDPGFEPEEVRYIRDVETLKALSDPTRVRILEAMVQRRSPAWSVKELAAALGVPQTRLYHHIELLLAQDLIRPAERRVVSGIIETRYAPAARNYQLDRSLFASGGTEGLEVLHGTMVAVFDSARADIERAILAGAATPADGAAESPMLLSRGLAALTPQRSAELRERLRALAEEFGADTDGDPDPDAQAYGVLLAVYPILDNPEPTDD